MLTQDDVPAPWRVVPGESPIDEGKSNAIENALDLSDGDRDTRSLISWDTIEHEANGMRVMLRMVPDYGTAAPSMQNIVGAIVSGMIALPAKGTEELRAAILREIPTRDIQHRTGVRFAMKNGAIADLTGDPDPRRAHLGTVARRWLELDHERVSNPARVIAEEYGRALSTVQAWIAEARDLGALPRNAQGKSGKPVQMTEN